MIQTLKSEEIKIGLCRCFETVLKMKDIDVQKERTESVAL